MSGRQAAADKGNHVRITLICTSRTAAAAQRDLRHSGGSRSVVAATAGDPVGEASGRGWYGRRRRPYQLPGYLAAPAM